MDTHTAQTNALAHTHTLPTHTNTHKHEHPTQAPWQKSAVDAYFLQTELPQSPLTAKIIPFPPKHTFSRDGRLENKGQRYTERRRNRKRKTK